MKVRDKIWLWCHEPNSHLHYGLPPSRITPVEAAAYMGIHNAIMIRYDKLEMPYDQFAIPFAAMDRLVWGLVGNGGATSNDERRHVMDMMPKLPNATGVFLDDFFLGKPEGDRVAVLSIEELREIKSSLKLPDRTLRLQITLYDYMLERPIKPYLDLVDDVTFWTWEAKNLDKLETHFDAVERIAPHAKKMLGLYMFDYGCKPRPQPIPVDRMQTQCQQALAWLKSGRIDGMIFLASCICDLGLEAVEFSRNWIRQIADQKL